MQMVVEKQTFLYTYIHTGHVFQIYYLGSFQNLLFWLLHNGTKVASEELEECEADNLAC
jgi:hypothetical protein